MDTIPKSDAGFGNTGGSMSGMPSSSLKGKLATMEVSIYSITIGRDKKDLQRDESSQYGCRGFAHREGCIGADYSNEDSGRTQDN